MKIDIIAIILVFISTLFAAWGSLYLKKGSIKFGLKSLLNGKLILGGIIYLLSTVFFIFALKRGEVSILYPMTSLSYIWISLISVKFLKEKMNKFKIMGIIFIILGVVVITV